MLPCRVLFQLKPIWKEKKKTQKTPDCFSVCVDILFALAPHPIHHREAAKYTTSKPILDLISAQINPEARGVYKTTKKNRLCWISKD